MAVKLEIDIHFVVDTTNNRTNEARECIYFLAAQYFDGKFLDFSNLGPTESFCEFLLEVKNIGEEFGVDCFSKEECPFEELATNYISSNNP
jgi:hypothetical protein